MDYFFPQITVHGQGGSRRTGLDRNMRNLVQVSGLEVSPQRLESKSLQSWVCADS
jgi:hypothetical protein